MCDCEDRDVSRASTTRRESAYEMITVDHALELVLEHSQPLETERVPVSDALGVVLAEAILSPEPVPPFRASLMDGYAVVAADGVGTFPVLERIRAGDVPTQALQSGHVAYITTGAAVPDGADAVVKVEDTQSSHDEVDDDVETVVTIRRAVTPGTNIRSMGSDIASGQVLVPAHTRVTAAEMGLLATVGQQHVVAFRSPLVGVLSTGNELVQDGAASCTDGKPRTIRDCNRPMLLALLQQWHVRTLDLGTCRDADDALAPCLASALAQVDVLLTTGGVSMGEHDRVKPLLARLGRVHFGRVRMKPGKPTTFATVQVHGTTKRLFALPGNPVSAFTTCHVLVRPALERLRGVPRTQCALPQLHAVLTHAVRLDPERPEFHRAQVVYDATQRHFVATSTGAQASSRLLSCRDANALLCLATGTHVDAGHVVPALLLDTSGIRTTTVGRSTRPTPSRATTSTVFRAGLLTISDRVFAGDAVDTSGPTMAALLAQVEHVEFEIVASTVVPDDVAAIQSVVTTWADAHAVDVLLTSGGTGLSPRDVTPEAIDAVLDKRLPGFPLAMLAHARTLTDRAILARPVAGVRRQTLILTFPGSPRAVTENFQAIATVLPHALHLVRDVAHEHHRPSAEERREHGP
ncbi:hypothetical protein PsorP6_007324 [Peronosclerospora sorghi]|uniref:Uncharacterized protein n=1 Tax=Peronosclerospora sorghi TaxID=230839 RepID=A0ACC0WAW7_9STRA|nr:hypothetical protein PsorP6_007324 [Peronosclerospora sorghi]